MIQHRFALAVCLDFTGLALIGSANLMLGMMGMLILYGVADTYPRLPA